MLNNSINYLIYITVRLDCHWTETYSLSFLACMKDRPERIIEGKAEEIKIEGRLASVTTPLHTNLLKSQRSGNKFSAVVLTISFGSRKKTHAVHVCC